MTDDVDDPEDLEDLEDLEDPDTTDEYPVPPPDPEAILGEDWNEDAGTPGSDPRHLDPAGDLAAAFESGGIDAELAEDADREELREFVERVEAGEFDADPGLEATVRIVRSLLNDAPE
jgi:hypothetical protein